MIGIYSISYSLRENYINGYLFLLSGRLPMDYTYLPNRYRFHLFLPYDFHL